MKIGEMSRSEKQNAQHAIAYLMEKRDGTIKGRTVFNSKPMQEWLGKEDSTSPMAGLESLILTAVIDAEEESDVMTLDVPNAFTQTPMLVEEGKDRVIMKITGVLINILVNKRPDKYAGTAVYENGKKVMYVEVLQAIYGMLNASLLWYKKFWKDL